VDYMATTEERRPRWAANRLDIVIVECDTSRRNSCEVWCGNLLRAVHRNIVPAKIISDDEDNTWQGAMRLHHRLITTPAPVPVKKLIVV
jgi:hypothetical protein